MSTTWPHFWSHALSSPASSSGRPSGSPRSAWRLIAAATNTDGAVALARLRGRGETIATIAKLAGVSEREVRAYLKAVPRNADAVSGAAAPARPPAADADDGTEGGPLLGASSGAQGGADVGSGEYRCRP
jgi:hypothetical protein